MTQEQLRSALNQAIGAQNFQPGTNMGQPVRTGQLTAAETQFAISELVRLLAPADVLEIGSFFADTSRVIASAMHKVGMGHLTTIDPFGGHRVPGIIAAWPEQLQEWVTFRPDNSMSFFLYLDEELHAQRGNQAPFEVIFVDGHHSFDYAFFDLMRSSLYVRPGGALVVDNIEQPGPTAAVRLFLERHTCWQLFKSDGADPDPQNLCFHQAANSAILLAPDGIEIGELPFRIDLYGLQLAEIRKAQLRVRRSAPGVLRFFVNFYSRPADCATTGEGEQRQCVTIDHKIGAADCGLVTIAYDPPLTLSPAPGDDISAQVELSFIPEGGKNLLVDVDSLKLG